MTCSHWSSNLPFSQRRATRLAGYRAADWERRARRPGHSRWDRMVGIGARRSYRPHFGPSLESSIFVGSPQIVTAGPPSSFQWNRLRCHPPRICLERSMMPSAPAARAASAFCHDGGSCPASKVGRHDMFDRSRSIQRMRHASASC